MKSYIKRSWLVLLGYIVFAVGILISVNRPLHGDILIPLELLFFAYCLRQPTQKQRSENLVQFRLTYAR